MFKIIHAFNVATAPLLVCVNEDLLHFKEMKTISHLWNTEQFQQSQDLSVQVNSYFI